MAKMTQELIEILYELGKNVYIGKMSLNSATSKVLNSHGDSIAKSSAEFYIGLVKNLVSGNGSTWNQNTALLVYYVEHICIDFGLEKGARAYEGAMKLAQMKSRKDIMDSLGLIREKYGLQASAACEGATGLGENLEKQTLQHISEYIEGKGLFYTNVDLINFYLCLKTKPFVILAGTSGTGKTKLVKLFAESIGAKYKLVPVRPDWSDSSDLFGHTNLQGEFVSCDVSDYVKEAMQDSNTPYFLCLDEMNLARVEYYFSEILSIIETREWDEDRIVTGAINQDDVAREKYGELILPDNLYLIGTVNMDETTFPFSKKVLDRANTIEFSKVDLIPDFSGEKEAVPFPVNNDFLKSKYLVLKKDVRKEQQELVSKICSELQEINGILEKANAHVGYRVRDEIVFYMLNNDEANLLDHNEAFDFEIMQKILPRIQGSSAAVKELLVELFKHCMGDDNSIESESKKIGEEMRSKAANAKKYPQSAKKIAYMMTRYEEDGFTSYWI